MLLGVVEVRICRNDPSGLADMTDARRVDFWSLPRTSALREQRLFNNGSKQ